VKSLRLNIGCGPSFEGDVRIDVRKTKAVTMIADAHVLPFKDESFSYVICTEVLEHLDSPFKALKEIFRVLTENGIAFLTVPNLTEIRRFLLIARNPLRVHCKETNHKQGWDAIEFNHLVRQVGFKILQVDWIDWHGRTERKEKYKFLNPLLERILPGSFYHTNMKIVCQKPLLKRKYPSV